MRRMRWIAAALLAAGTTSLGAQGIERLRAGVNQHANRNLAPAVSLVLPGSGQLMEGKQRFLVYATIEALYWWKYSKDSRERSRAADEYKDLARRVARSHFRPNAGDGDWTYYESMRDYLESGDFSKTETGPVVPEPDSLTFNGRLWLLIRRTTPGCTDQVQACDGGLARYEGSAISADLQWSWRNSQLQLDLFRRTTELRNDANHAAVTDLSVLALNHLLSMVDAFTVLRLESHVDSRGRPSVGAALRW